MSLEDRSRPPKFCRQLGHYKLCLDRRVAAGGAGSDDSCKLLQCRCSCRQKWQRRQREKWRKVCKSNQARLHDRDPGRARSRWPRLLLAGCGSFGRTSVGVCGRKLRVQTAAARQQRGWWDSRSRSSVGIGAAWTRDEEVGCGQVQGPHHPLGPVLCRGPHLAVPHQRQHNNNNLAHAACLELSDEISDMSD